MSNYLYLNIDDVHSEARNKWHNECLRKQIPFIILTTKNEVAHIEWDYITYANEDVSLLKSEAFTIAAKELFFKYSESESSYQISSATLIFKNLKATKAKLAADELANLVSELFSISRIET